MPSDPHPFKEICEHCLTLMFKPEVKVNSGWFHYECYVRFRTEQDMMLFRQLYQKHGGAAIRKWLEACFIDAYREEAGIDKPSALLSLLPTLEDSDEHEK
jgi:hypothetical protein